MTRFARRTVVLLALSAGFTACPPPPATTDGGACSGQVGCECSASSPCAASECVGGTCVDCRRGEAACSCRVNSTCNAGLRCSSSVCETCPAGESGCACGTGDTCGAGLACTNGTCTSTACVPGAANCPCRTTTPACDGTATCEAMVCQSCSADRAGCPCGSGNTCAGGLVCDTTLITCRAPVTCASLRMAGTCKANQLCNESAGTDAVCVAATCEAGFKWDPGHEVCVACTSTNCQSEPTCAGSVGTQCALEHRTCVQTGNFAGCDVCSPGYTEFPGGVCAPTPLCGNTTCAADQYCDATLNCTPRPCPAGQAKEPSMACTACNLTCATAGFSGSVWPLRTTTGVCVCETLQGYFLPAGANGQAALCDADGDGWVNEDADSSNDPVLKANARCTIRKVDSVRLVDELGTGMTIRSCTPEGMVPADGGTCTNAFPLRLLETPRNDTPGQPMGQLAPAYGVGTDGGSRLLEANELNSLTKACVSLTANYNDNATEDINEVGLGRPMTALNDRIRLESFAYFVELHTSYYEAPVSPALNGTLVIRERSRCDLNFPFHYDPTASAGSDAFSTDAGETYWRDCGRRRDTDFAPSTATFDFAQWDCSATSGSCPYVPPASATLSAPVDPSAQALRNYGVCSLNGNPPADGLWRGMTHHSQFKCVNVTSTVARASDRLPGDFSGPASKYLFNSCGAETCASPGDPACQTSQGSGAQTKQPVVKCAAQPSVLTGKVGWAVTKFQEYGPSNAGYSTTNYTSGCVNEDVETAPPSPIPSRYLSYLCPYPEYFNVSVSDATKAAEQRTKSSSAFGRSSCANDLPNSLWAQPTERATLYWAFTANDTTYGFLR